MVNLTRIYTRTGDGGQTRLGSGAPVRKTDPRVEAYGDVDEANAAIGAALAGGLGEVAMRVLRQVQNDLFDVGADLCVPLSAPRRPGVGPALRVTAAQVVRLEAAIDATNADLEPLRSFVLPGGTPGAARLHVARTACRRAERRAWALVESVGPAEVNAVALSYLNRLSDLLFVLARAENAHAAGDLLWTPGGTDAL